jgi:hypothetical protein
MPNITSEFSILKAEASEKIKSQLFLGCAKLPGTATTRRCMCLGNVIAMAVALAKISAGASSWNSGLHGEV